MRCVWKRTQDEILSFEANGCGWGAPALAPLPIPIPDARTTGVNHRTHFPSMCLTLVLLPMLNCASRLARDDLLSPRGWIFILLWGHISL